MRKSWTETTVGDIAELISRGKAPSYCEEDGVTVINQKCIRNGRIYFEFARLTDSRKKSIPDWAFLKVGDTLINSTGVGTLGRASLVSRLEEKTTFDSHVTLVRPNPNLCFPSFVGLFLNFRERDIEMFGGGSTGQTELSREAVSAFPITIPPLTEQKRIVDVMSSVDAYIDALQQQADTARTARNAVLHELLSAGGDDWTETTLGAHIKIVMGQAPPGKDCNKEGVGVPFVKAGEFTDGFPVIREWTTNPLRYSKLGDTLICVVGATCGKLSKGIDCAIGRSVAALQPLENLDAGFLWNFMARKVQEMRDGSRGSAQGVITKDDLADLPLNLPPLAEQKRIAEIVSSMDEVIQSTEQAVEDTKNLRSGLLSDLLSGEHEIPTSYDKFLQAA
jgi:restriction endonuclease S subunit